MKNRKKQDNATAQSAIYVGFVDTPGLFASIIRRVIGQNYVHVVLGFDPELKEAYSIGRRNPAVPLFAGFERENREKILKKYQPALICATQGKNGSIAYYKGQSFCQKAFIRKDTVETTGAGDTFMACVLNSVLEKGLNNLTESDILHMLKFASAASSIITTKRGALKVMPQKEDIIVFLNNYSCNMPNL